MEVVKRLEAGMTLNMRLLGLKLRRLAQLTVADVQVELPVGVTLKVGHTSVHTGRMMNEDFGVGCTVKEVTALTGGQQMASVKRADCFAGYKLGTGALVDVDIDGLSINTNNLPIPKTDVTVQAVAPQKPANIHQLFTDLIKVKCKVAFNFSNISV